MKCVFIKSVEMYPSRVSVMITEASTAIDYISELMTLKHIDYWLLSLPWSAFIAIVVSSAGQLSKSFEQIPR